MNWNFVLSFLVVWRISILDLKAGFIKEYKLVNGADNFKIIAVFLFYSFKILISIVVRDFNSLAVELSLKKGNGMNC